MSEEAVFDRVEDKQHAVLLVGPSEEERIIPVGQIPSDCNPGDWLILETDAEGNLQIRPNPEATQKAAQRIQDKMNRLRQRGRKL